MKITEEQLSEFCRIFHKTFRQYDMKNDADIDMYKAIVKLDNIDYSLAVKGALRDALDIEVEK